MRAVELITQSVPVLKMNDTVASAQQLMNDNHLSQLPLVDGTQLLGLVREEDILNAEPEETLGTMKLALIRPFIHDYEHIFEVLKVASELKMRIVPVINEGEAYVGSITLEGLLNYFAQETDILESGGIVVLEMEVKDYSLSDVTRVIEAEGGRVLCVFAGSNPDTSKMELTLKINKPDLQVIIAALERHNYVIKDTYQEPEYFDNLKNRFDSLMNYLNV